MKRYTRGGVTALRRAGCAALLFTGLLAPILATAGGAWFASGGGVYDVPVRSIAERKFEQVVRQQYDFSCGSAALATLLTFHYARPTTEQETFRAMYAVGDQEKIARVGFSLLDMKNYLDAHGYQADGFKAPLETLVQAGVPAIALITVKGYQHFVVIKGVQKNEVLLGDPALGIKAVPLAAFATMWTNGILFIVRNESRTGQEHFNMVGEWRSLPRAPLDAPLGRESLAAVTLSLPDFTRPMFGDF